MIHSTRRGFLKRSAVMVGAAGLSPAILQCLDAADDAAADSAVPLIRSGDVVLFQGDSITDAGRSRAQAEVPNMQGGLGSGYAWLAAAELLVDRAGDGLRVFNRGISGHKVFQLAARWEQDCLNLKPDVLSILIGVNDIWHGLNGKYDGTVEVYERDYNALLTRTRGVLPEVKLVVCEPFVLRCGAVTEKWFPLMDHDRAAARRVATRHQAVFVPFQAIFDRAVEYAPPKHWAGDGVHPSAAGASLMAHSWLRAVA